jgi:UDP-N-acetylmuramate dehydrogenase
MILRNISLKPYNTFGLEYKADCLVIFKTEEEAIVFFRKRGLCADPLLILGEGSNVLFTSDFKGTVLYPGIEEIKQEKQDDANVVVSVGAGVKWDNFVEWCVNSDIGGVENLSLIPGLTGAAPIQNIGAYGVEAKDTIERVTAVNMEDGSLTEFTNEQCRFGYRDSIFKGEHKCKYLIIRIYFKLSTNPVLNTGYYLLKEEVEKIGGETLKNVRQAVINIRKRKLPDPKILGNAGSFFKNPVVSISAANTLRERHPSLPAYPDQSGGMKLAAGWLIEQCGWKGKRIGDAGVHDKQALVLVNYGNATGRELFNLSEQIKNSVFKKFGITLEREVEVIGIT